MKKIVYISFLLIFLVTLSFSQQNNNWAGPVQKLRARLQYYQKLAEQYHAPKIIAAVKKAEADLDQAIALFQRFRFHEAWLYFKKARKTADFLERQLYFKPTLQGYTQVEKQIHQAERLVQSSHSPEARYMINKSRAFFEQATLSFKQSRFIRGQEFQRIALYFANKAIDIVRGKTVDLQNGQVLNQKLIDMQKLYRDISTSVNDNSDARQLLNKAKIFMENARKQMERGKTKQALIQLQISERLLYRTIDLNQKSGRGRKEQLTNNLRSLNKYIRSLEPAIAENTNGRQLLRKARQFARAAENNIKQNRFEKASAQISLSQRMATKALRFISGPTGEESADIEQRIAEVEKLLKLQASHFPRLDATLQDQVKRLIFQARRARENGHPRLALSYLRFGVRLINRLTINTKEKQYSSRDIKQLNDRYRHLQFVLQKISASNGTSPYVLAFQKFMSHILNTIQQNLDQGNYRIAEALIEITQKKVNQFLKNVPK